MNFPNHYSRGYTLLFAVLISAFVLSLATSILFTSRRQAALSNASHDSMHAVYAADTGLECARYFDSFYSPATGTAISNVACGTGTTPTSNWSNSGGTWTASFDTFFSGSIESCAKVTLQKYYDLLGNLISKIESRGYSFYDGSNCPANHPQVVERALRLTY